jgi:hypothetical protein
LFWVITIVGCVERQLVRPTPQMDIEPRFWVRVLLLDDCQTCTLKSATPFTVSHSESQTAQALFSQLDTPINIGISAAKITIAGRIFTGTEVTIAPDSPHIFTLNGNDYRGKLKLIVNPDGSSFDAINLVPLEPYLAGVIGAEMPDYWEQAALQAQAIAARTYCLYIKNRFGNNRSWDMRPTTANQVYLGVKAESSRVWKAVNQTHTDRYYAAGKTRRIRNTSSFPPTTARPAAAIPKIPPTYSAIPSSRSLVCRAHTAGTWQSRVFSSGLWRSLTRRMLQPSFYKTTPS